MIIFIMDKPNIIFILADDLGWRDLGCYGSTFYQTPNLDRLSAEGMFFTEAYATCPVCSPTRASVLTGKYPARIGLTNWIDWSGKSHPNRGKIVDVPYIRDLPESETTLATALKNEGYDTWHVGKWHLGGPGSYPTDHGFDVNLGGCEHGSPGTGGYFSPWSVPALREMDVPEGTYLTDYLTDRAGELIERSGEGPFFLNLWYYAVHTPIQAKDEVVEKYRKKAADLGLENGLEEGLFFPCEHKKNSRIVRRRIQSDPIYAAMVETLDSNIGRLVEALKRSGKEKNTLIIFTSDNGGLSTSESSPTCNAPLSEGKGWMYEGGTREPLIVSWPGTIKPGSTCDEPVTAADFYPTILEAVGAESRPKQHIDACSFYEALQRPGTFRRNAPIFWHYPHYGNQGGTPGASVRDGDWKLIRFFEDDHEELYNLRNDIGETKNLAETESEKRAVLSAKLTGWQEEIEALIPEPNPDYVPWDGRKPCGHFGK